MSRIGKSIEIVSKWVVAWGLGERKMERAANGYRVSIWDDENVLELGGGDGCTTLLNATELYLMPLNCTH